MGNMGQLRIGLLAIAALVAAPATASAHAYVMDPPSRDVGIANLDARAHKTGPCGGSKRTGVPTKYAPGQTIKVKWQETIDHRGCFQIAVSPKDDANFVTLLQMNDPANTPDNFVWMADVKLPMTPCASCTLVVRQLMNGNQACTGDTANPMNPANASNGTYFSCADICIGDNCDTGDAGAGGDAGPTTDSGTSTTDSGTSSSGGPTTTPTDGGGKTVPGDDDDSNANPNLRSGAGDDGCSVGFADTSGAWVFAPAGLVGLALLRRRKNRR